MTERAQATLNPAQNDLECVIQVEGVSKVFHTPSQTNLEALTDIKLDVRPGEFVTVVGPSGCGKSTLLKLIAGFSPPSAGRILFQGEEVRGLNTRVGYVPQESKLFPLLTVDLIPVVAPDHPLAALEGPIDTHVLHRHVQLVLTDRSSLTAGRDYGVLSGRTWRLADLGAKQSMLLAGLGWGNMPSHLVQDDIAQGRLKVIRPMEFDPRVAQLVMCGAYLANRMLGPAGQWMIEHLSTSIGSQTPTACISPCRPLAPSGAHRCPLARRQLRDNRTCCAHNEFCRS